MQEIAIEIFFEKHSDGRYYIKSFDVPGLHLAGTDFTALQEDLDPAVKALLHYNLGFDVESIKWVPSPEDARNMLDKPQPEGKATYIALVKAAA
jgi:hypothetical protein